MTKDNTIYLEHIIDALDKISKYIQNQDLKSFLDNEEKQDAIVRKLEIIGEATKKISRELKIKNPQVPWKDMAGMRDKLIHDYFDVDLSIVWETAVHDVPELKQLLSALKY
jgi:uncharacterized protein with HEPN domain